MSLADELERLGKLATEGPWFQWPYVHGATVCAQAPVKGDEPLCLADFDMDTRVDHDTTSCANAALVSKLMQNLPAIIKALRAQEQKP